MSSRSSGPFAAQVAEEADALLAHPVEVDRVPLGLERLHPPARFLDQVRVEGAGEPAVRGHQNDRSAGGPALGRRRRGPEQREAVGQLGRHQIGQDLAQRLGVGPGGDDAVLRPLQLGRGDQLHRPGDLAGILDRADPALELPSLGHQSATNTDLKASIAFLSRPVRSSSSAFLVRMSVSTAGCEASRKSMKSRSHCRMCFTSTSSR